MIQDDINNKTNNYIGESTNIAEEKHVKGPYTKDTRLLINCKDGDFMEYSVNQNKVIHRYEKFNVGLYNWRLPEKGSLNNFVTTYDKKSVFMIQGSNSTVNGTSLCKFNIKSGKFEKKIFGLHSLSMAVTNDNKYLIIDSYVSDKLDVRSTRTQKLIYSLKLNSPEQICTLEFSPDNRYLFVGHAKGHLQIFDLQNGCISKGFQPTNEAIFAITIFKNNRWAQIGDEKGKILKIRWKNNSNTKQEFGILKHIQQATIKSLLRPRLNAIFQLRLIDNEKNLLINSINLISIYNLTKNRSIKSFAFHDSIIEMELANNDRNIVVAEKNGDLTIIDLDLLVISKKIQKTVQHNNIHTMKIIS